MNSTGFSRALDWEPGCLDLSLGFDLDYAYARGYFSNQSNSYGGYDSAKQNASAPQVAANPYEELEDDGELPF